MKQPMVQTRQLDAGTIPIDFNLCEAGCGERNVIFEYSDNHPQKLFVKLISNDPDITGGSLKSYSTNEVEKLRRFITQVHNLMKGAVEDEDS